MRSLQTSIVSSPLPEAALLRRYLCEGTYTDCYITEVSASIPLPAYVEAFYTTRVFKLERWILTHLVSKSSNDVDAKRLAHAQSNSFAAWRVEDRTVDVRLRAANPFLVHGCSIEEWRHTFVFRERCRARALGIRQFEARHHLSRVDGLS